MSYAESIALIEGLKNKAERQHNLFGFNQFSNWFHTFDGRFIEPPHTVYQSELGYLQVKFDPETAFYNKGEGGSILMWNTKEPEMTRFIGGCIVHFLAQEFKNSSFRAFRFGLFDLRSDRRYREKDIPSSALDFILRELRAIESLWLEIQDEYDGGPAGRGAHDHPGVSKHPKGF